MPLVFVTLRNQVTLMRKRYELGEERDGVKSPMIWDIEHLLCGLVYLFPLFSDTFHITFFFMY